ncbi:DNA polymerase IV [Bacillus velezensis]|uniref:DNA polymerase IV n=1 Tax=Bacillus velezensis TaxID=492670 RepID=UPI0010398B49|nr:DNA polymerase IV [Bacillus velezensis]QBK22843.1 DNA polymerase IV [Bacillus velezensis]QWK23742.1 DNA polymerase IV [Bacillus velezensis]
MADILLVDMQSFYASVEKAEAPHLKSRPMIVSGDPERRSGVVLAACPLAKRYGVKNAERLWEAQAKCPDAVIVRPRMQRYIDVSVMITELFERYTDLVEPYSIDEQFLDVTGSRRLFGDPFTIAESIQQAIMREFGIYARVGIGPNKALAKMACDHFAKKNASGIHRLDMSNIREDLWPLPVGKLFGIGKRMEHHLRRMGISTIGGLAGHPAELLKKRWGINGELLQRTARGIDPSPVTVNTHSRQKAIGHNMTLPRDYSRFEDIKVVLLELSEEVARRARFKQYIGHTVSVSIRGADFEFPSGFHRQRKLVSPTNFGMDIFKAAVKLFKEHWNGEPVRSAGVSLSQLEPCDYVQLSLFDAQEKKISLGKVLDDIHERYGPASLLHAASLTEAGQAFHRAEKIGGHYK